MSIIARIRSALAALGWLHQHETIPPPLLSGASLPRQLLVDVSIIAAADSRTGIQRVVRGILGQLSATEQHEFVVRPVIATKRMDYVFLSEDGSGRGPPVHPNPNDIFLALDLAPAILPRHERQLRRWRKQGVLISVVLYDMLPVSNPAWFKSRSVRNFDRWLRCVERQADQVICISDHVRREFVKWRSIRRRSGPQRAIQLETIRLSGDISAATPSSESNAYNDALLSWALRKHTVLMVGTIEPRKGHLCALRAFEAIWEGGVDLQLLLVGRPGWKTGSLQSMIRGHSELGRRLLWIDNASDALLLDFYRNCAGVFMPSYAEGFGLPIAEALYNGKRVLARNLPVLEDFEDERLTSFTDDRPHPLASSIMKWLAAPVDDPNFDTRQTTWRDTTNMLLSTLRDSSNAESKASS